MGLSHDGAKILNIMWYVYILLLRNKQLYTGFSSNLKQRLLEHQNGKVYFTKYRLPAKLIHYEVYLLEDDARRREKFLKTTEGKKLLRRQLSTLLKELGLK